MNIRGIKNELLLLLLELGRGSHPNEFVALLREKNGVIEELDMVPEPGGWGVFTASFVPTEGGVCSVEVSCKEAERSLTTRLVIQSPKRERAGRPARAGVLREISALTGGMTGSHEDLDRIVQGISVLPEVKPLEERVRLWCHPLWAALLIALLAAYWTGRKLAGQI